MFALINPSYPGDGGSFPECHVAQYPLEMGKKKVSSRVLSLFYLL